MKKIIMFLCLFCLGISPIFGINQDDQKSYETLQKEEVRSKFSYLRLDYGIPGLIGINCGKRGQLNHNGFDIAIGSYALLPTFASINLDINYLIFRGSRAHPNS